jgi:hypothetical protein
MVAAAFTHRNHRATQICTPTWQWQQGPDPRRSWLSIDGRLLFKATVAASEPMSTAGYDAIRA